MFCTRAPGGRFAAPALRLHGRNSAANMTAPTAPRGRCRHDARLFRRIVRAAKRWSHGYAYEYIRPWDVFWPDGPLPIEAARQPWGRIAIANADSGAYAYAH